MRTKIIEQWSRCWVGQDSCTSSTLAKRCRTHLSWLWLCACKQNHGQNQILDSGQCLEALLCAENLSCQTQNVAQTDSSFFKYVSLLLPEKSTEMIVKTCIKWNEFIKAIQNGKVRSIESLTLEETNDSSKRTKILKNKFIFRKIEQDMDP